MAGIPRLRDPRLSQSRFQHTYNMAKKKEKAAAPATSPEDILGNKLEALNNTLANIHKDYGEDKLFLLGSNEHADVEVISTGSLGVDHALGVGGLPRGRIIEIYGPESSGKTTLAIHAIAEAQKNGGIAALIDAEHAFDRTWAETIGVDVNRLWVAQPDNGEQALDIAEQLINSGASDRRVIASVAALTPKDEIEGEMGDRNMGLQARLMSQAMRKLTSAISRTRTCCIFINQLREKIGVFMGNPETTTGGNALKFYASVRLEIRASTPIKVGDEIIGRRTKIKVAKNKVAPPFTKCEFDMLFGKGISRAGEVLDYAVDYDIITKSGSWYSYRDSKLGQGRDAVRAIIEDNPELFDELQAEVRARLFPAPESASAPEPEATAAEEAPAKPAKGGKVAPAAGFDAVPDGELDLNLTDNF